MPMKYLMMSILLCLSQHANLSTGTREYDSASSVLDAIEPQPVINVNPDDCKNLEWKLERQ
ncbi:MAG: hypothetical protein CM1200mP28_13630 [Deltaproteobacteria bacterium]|nr:MAG: hypothetical protein CM1200mP28_13630 [Deltaproteobacteria bacterium]